MFWLLIMSKLLLDIPTRVIPRNLRARRKWRGASILSSRPISARLQQPLMIFLFFFLISAWVVGGLHYGPLPASFNHVPRSLVSPRSPPLFSRVQQRRTLLISGERLRRLEGTRLRGLSVSRWGRREERWEIERGEAAPVRSTPYKKSITSRTLYSTRYKI